MTLLSGLMRSLVRVTAATPPNYEVHTPNAVAAARGTTFDTYYTNNTRRRGFKSCREFTDVQDFDGVVAVRSLANPSSPTVQLHSGQKTTVPCGLVLLPASSLAAISAGGAGGLSTATVAAASLGGVAVVTGGVVGSYAGVGGFSSNSPPPPAKNAATPTR